MNKMSAIRKSLLAIGTVATLMIALPSQAADHYRQPSYDARYHDDARRHYHNHERYERRVDYRHDRYRHSRYCDLHRYHHDARYRRDWDRRWH